MLLIRRMRLAPLSGRRSWLELIRCQVSPFGEVHMTGLRSPSSPCGTLFPTAMKPWLVPARPCTWSPGCSGKVPAAWVQVVPFGLVQYAPLPSATQPCGPCAMNCGGTAADVADTDEADNGAGPLAGRTVASFQVRPPLADTRNSVLGTHCPISAPAAITVPEYSATALMDWKMLRPLCAA